MFHCDVRVTEEVVFTPPGMVAQVMEAQPHFSREEEEALMMFGGAGLPTNKVII